MPLPPLSTSRPPTCARATRAERSSSSTSARTTSTRPAGSPAPGTSSSGASPPRPTPSSAIARSCSTAASARAPRWRPPRSAAPGGRRTRWRAASRPGTGPSCRSSRRTGMWRTTSLALLLALALAAPAAAAPTLTSVGSFDAPIYAASPPRDTSRLFVVERGGRVWVVKGGHKLAGPFLDISGDVATDGERGLLSIAFSPDYESNGLFYLYMVAANPLGELQVREYHRSAANPDRADPTGRIVWSQAHPRSNHNGGTIQFGPDGMLWIATGDGGGQGDADGNAQNLSRQLGKVLRIDPRPSGSTGYTVPAGNPYGSPVWAAGLRNPFRWSFDRGTEDLVIGDVGGSVREEIDFVRRSEGLGRGLNFGWPCREGLGPGPSDCQPGQPYRDPVFDYPTAGAVTGGVVVRDPGLPTLAGRYLFVDFYASDIRSMTLDLPRARDERSAGLPPRSSIAAFAEDACGHVYLVSLNGTVERVQDGAAGACVLRAQPPPLPALPDGGTQPVTPPAQPGAADRTPPPPPRSPPRPPAPRRAPAPAPPAAAASPIAPARGSRSPPRSRVV